MNGLLLKALCNESFWFEDEQYDYCRSNVNTAFKTERSVEVPVSLKLVKDCKGRVLEVGNVLSNYSKVDHDVLDLYERGDHIINDDICSYSSDVKYDLVVSVSTLEHIGYDYGEPDAFKIHMAIKNMLRLLAPGGLLFFTVPTGYNKMFDRLLYVNKYEFSLKTMQRFDRYNNWRQIDAQHYAAFNYPYQYGNMVVFGYKYNIGLTYD